MNVGIGNIGDIIKNKYLYKENTIFMNQTEMIKALVKVLREDIRKTIKEEVRSAIKEVLNEQVEAPKEKKVNENYQMKSKDNGEWGTMDFRGRQAAPARPMISPSDLGYGDGFESYVQPDNSWGAGSMNEEYGSYMQGQEEGGIPLATKAQIAAQRNPQAAKSVMNALNRDYSQLVKKFNKG